MNPAGYQEYRATYFAFTAAGTLSVLLGQGSVGTGPTRERYNVAATRVNLTVLAAGQPQDDYAVRFLGSNANNTIQATNGVSVGVAMLPAETATIASATISNGASLSIGLGTTFSGTLTIDGASAVLNAAPAAVVAQNGASVTVSGIGLTWAAITAKGGSNVTWLADGTITALVLQTGSRFDKSQDTRALTITNSTQDGDTTQVADPWNAITWSNAITVSNAASSGPFVFGPSRTVKIT